MRLLNVFLKDPPCDRSYKEIYALDIYKEIVFGCFPEFVHNQQRWRCHSCGQWLRGLAVNVHQCRFEARIDALKLNAAGLVCPSGKRVGSETHSCGSAVWNTYAYDLSHLLDYGNELDWGGDAAKQMIQKLRSSSVPVVIVSRDMPNSYLLILLAHAGGGGRERGPGPCQRL
jgi:hypothetical protein